MKRGSALSTISMTVLVLIGLFVLVAPSLAGTWSDGFEDGNLDAWQREVPPMGGEK